MSSPKLSLLRVTESEQQKWDDLIAVSPQGSLFAEWFYLKATAHKHHLYWVKQGTGTEIKAALALMVSEDETCCELDDLVIYGGVHFNLDNKRQLVKRRHDEFQIIEFVIAQLTERYAAIELQLSPAFTDLRPFLWYRYHDESSKKFALDLRYTSYVDISSLRDFVGREEESPCFNEMETVRRYSVREARKKGGSVRRVDSGAQLVALYAQLMNRQGDAQSTNKLSAMQNVITALLERGRGAVYEVLNSTGVMIYSICYGWDTKRAYYLFGAGHAEISEPWQGTIAHWEAFKDLAQRLDINEIDLEGVNSPQRGWFKLGFGGDLRQYYAVSKQVTSDD